MTRICLKIKVFGVVEYTDLNHFYTIMTAAFEGSDIRIPTPWNLEPLPPAYTGLASASPTLGWS